MTSTNRRAFARVILAAGLAAAGVRTHAENAPDVLRIGYQKSSTLITLLKTRGALEQALAPLGLRVSWHEFASGLPLTEALNVGAVDFSADVADTVPVFAQAARARFVYVAQEAPSPKAQAIVVKQDSALRTLADLKDKRIAVTKAAGSHYLLLAALARAKLGPADVAVHYLTPADGRAAFERDSVDAWITWDPYVASVDRNPDVRILADGNGLASYQRYYLASSSFAAARPDVLDPVRPVVASGHVAAQPPAGGREYPRADLGARRRDDRARERAAQLCRSCCARAKLRRTAEDRRHVSRSRATACPRRHEPGAALEFRGETRRTGRRVRIRRARGNIFSTLSEIMLTDSADTLE